MEEKNTFGAYLRRKRQEAGLTQRALAELLYVSESAVSKWERDLSYPDVQLIPDICRNLDISEHEFFAACDDSPSHVEQAARRWQRLVHIWQWFFGLCYGISAAVCLICNLAVGHRLDWFWIVLTALMLSFCFTNLPFLVKRGRTMACLSGGTVSLLLLLLACWANTGGTWGLKGIAITAVSLVLPWSIYLLWHFYGKYMVPLSAAIFSLWCYALLGVVWLSTGGTWLLGLAVPITTVCLVFLWGMLAVILWAPVNRWCKWGMAAALAALAIPAGNALPAWLSPSYGQGVPIAAYFNPGLAVSMGQAGNRIVFWLLLLTAAVLLVTGVIQAIQKTEGK